MTTLAQPRTLLDHPWRIAALVAVVTNVTFSYASEALARHGESIAAVSARYANPFTPASYAFAIWGIIYGATLAYAVLALLPQQLSVRLHDRVAPWLALLNVLSLGWLMLFSSALLVPSLIVILAMLGASGVAFGIATRHLASERLSAWWRAPFALWLGWLGVAAIANLSIVITEAGWDGMPISATTWAMVMLVGVAIAGWLANLVLGDIVVPLVVAWAAAAIAVAHFEESTLLGIVAVAVALKSALWAGSSLLFSAFPISRHYRALAGRALRYDPQAPPRFPS